MDSKAEKNKLKVAIEVFYNENRENPKVYENNWSANSRESLIRKIKKCAAEIDQDVIIKMFDNLKNRIHLTNENRDSYMLRISSWEMTSAI